MSFKIDPAPGAEIKILDGPVFPFRHFEPPSRRLVPCLEVEGACPICEVVPPRTVGIHDLVYPRYCKHVPVWTEAGPEWRTVWLPSPLEHTRVWIDFEGDESARLRELAERHGVTP